MTLLEQLQALAPLAAQATEGPWEVIPNSENTDSVHSPEANHTENFGLGNFRSSSLCMSRGGFAHDADAAFIAQARNVLTPENVARLIAALGASASSIQAITILNTLRDGLGAGCHPGTGLTHEVEIGGAIIDACIDALLESPAPAEPGKALEVLAKDKPYMDGIRQEVAQMITVLDQNQQFEPPTLARLRGVLLRYDALQEAASAPAVTGWVAVADRLPEEQPDPSYVLGFYEDGDVRRCQVYNRGLFCDFPARAGSPTHWMPMPPAATPLRQNGYCVACQYPRLVLSGQYWGSCTNEDCIL